MNRQFDDFIKKMVWIGLIGSVVFHVLQEQCWFFINANHNAFVGFRVKFIVRDVLFYRKFNLEFLVTTYHFY